MNNQSRKPLKKAPFCATQGSRSCWNSTHFRGSLQVGDQRFLQTVSPTGIRRFSTHISLYTHKSVLESHWPEEVPDTARHPQWPELISNSSSWWLLPLLARLRTSLEEQQEQSRGVNKMAQRRSFKEVLLSPWQPGACRQHSDTKVPTEAVPAIFMAEMFSLFLLNLQIAALTHCKTDPKMTIKWKTTLSTFLSPLQGTSYSRDSFSCGLGFVVLFLMKSNLRLQRGLSSHLLCFINIWWTVQITLWGRKQ